MINQLSLSQLEHKARIEGNELALIILDKMEEEIEEAVELATKGYWYAKDVSKAIDNLKASR